jgi:hypothetical protein
VKSKRHKALQRDGLQRSRTLSSISDRYKTSIASPPHPHRLWTHPNSCLMGNRALGQSRRAWNWLLASIESPALKIVKLFMHSITCLHGVVLNWAQEWLYLYVFGKNVEVAYYPGIHQGDCEKQYNPSSNSTCSDQDMIHKPPESEQVPLGSKRTILSYRQVPWPHYSTTSTKYRLTWKSRTTVTMESDSKCVMYQRKYNLPVHTVARKEKQTSTVRER